jgi:hypothetical protein
MSNVINKIGEETLLDAFISAFEGGSNYWYQIVEHSGEYKLIGDDTTVYDVLKSILDGCTKSWVKIEAPEYPQIEAELVTHSKIIEGLKVMAMETPRHYSDIVTENADAETGDVFLQHVLFGKTIFG